MFRIFTHRILFFFLSLLAALALHTFSFAADIQLTMGHQSINDSVIVSLENKSSLSVMIDAVYIELNQKKYSQAPRQNILPRQKMEFKFKIIYPSAPGTYPLTGAVRYVNDGRLLSLKHTSLYTVLEPAPLDITCALESSRIAGSGDIVLRSSQPQLWRLILPDEITETGSAVFPDRKVFHVTSALPDFRCTYVFFAAAETAADGRHQAALASGTLSSGPEGAAPYKRGRAPSGLLAALALFFLSASVYLLQKNRLFFLLPAAPNAAQAKKKKASPANTGGSRNRIIEALAKYACRMFFVAGCYFLLKNADAWADFFLALTGWEPVQYLLTVVRDNFRGSNYEYFFKYAADYYLGACILLTLPYLYFFDGETPLEKDKYACFLATLLTLGSVLKGTKPYWNYQSRLGMLTVFVKVFYIPYLTSWAINNTFHQKNLVAAFHWDLATVNAFLVALFIYIDTLVFAFGYMAEAGYLKNKIKSVEPTVLGWAVCLWCYPPFNAFSFKLFDHPIISIAHEYPGWVQACMTCLISALWGIFTWASLALGFRASNLTNRGIIASGPYRFARHPAYAAKVIIWIIQGIFFTQYTAGILLGFALIYFLRAWTEERHLSLDPEYVAYKKKVRWMFIPGVV